MTNNFLLAQTVQVPTYTDKGFTYKDYDAEVGTISKAFLGFEPDHNWFSLAIEIKEAYRDNTRSTGYMGLPNTPSSMALVREVIKTIGGDYSNLSSLVGKPAILMRDGDASWTPVGIASPVTGKFCLFKTDYSIVKEEEVEPPF